MLSEKAPENAIFQSLSVPRETERRFNLYVSLLTKWQNSVNLISRSTLPHVWDRHIADSYQLLKYVPESSYVADLGSGAGLPGMVLAMGGIKDVTLIESDQKKVAFLREVSRQLGLNVNIINQRVEEASLQIHTSITARAFASVKDILTLTKHNRRPDAVFYLLKGKTYKEELEEAQKEWTFEMNAYPSITDSSGSIIVLKNCQPKEG